MLAEILPVSVACAERFDDLEPVTPYPEEEAVVARSAAGRRDSFHTVRHCARLAMVKLGRPATPVLPGPKGEPLWPAGLVGSMTHCAGYRGAVAAPATALMGLGIDAEPHKPLRQGVLEYVALPAERERLARLARTHPSTHWDRLLVSAKESVYKVWFPLTRKWLDFDEADITLLPDGRFTARLLVPGRSGGPPNSRPLRPLARRRGYRSDGHCRRLIGPTGAHEDGPDAKHEAAMAARRAYSFFDACRVLLDAQFGKEHVVNCFQRAEALVLVRPKG